MRFKLKKKYVHGANPGDVVGDFVCIRATSSQPSDSSPDWQRAVIEDRSLIVPGPKGDSVKGDKGDSGETVVGPPGIVWRGLFNRRTEYKPNDAVTFDGSSWIAVAASQGREPSDTSRYWQIMAERGRAGRDGRDSTVPGPRGPGSGRLNLLQEQVDELLEGTADLPEAIAEVAITRGQVVYIREDNANLDLAQANAFATSKPIGIAADTVSAGQTCRYVTGGAVTNPDWNLDPGRVYFVSDDVAGELTLTEPSDPGDYVLIVGTAASATTLIVEIHRAYVIGPVA